MRLLVGTLLFALVGAAAHASADVVTLSVAGGWRAFYTVSSDGKPMCGLGAHDFQTGRYLFLKWFAGDGWLSFQAFHNGWRIPEGTRLAVSMHNDAHPPWIASGATGVGDHVEWTLVEGMVEFLREFRYSSVMVIAFPDGTEAPWTVDLTGTNTVTAAFAGCILKLRTTPGAQPVSPPQPFGAPVPRTQPFGAHPPPRRPAPAAPGTAA